MAKMSGQGVRTHHWRAVGRSKVAHFSQCFPSGQHIRIGCYRLDGVDLDSMAARILLGSPDGVDPDSMRRMSSQGIRMELSRMGPYTLPTQTVPLRRPDISSGIMFDQTCPDTLIGYFTFGSPDAGWERRHFKFPEQACLDLLIALIQRASAADISDYPDHSKLKAECCTVSRCSPEAS